MDAAEFVNQAWAHYAGKLIEEKERFGVLGISAAWIENNARRVVEGGDEDGAGEMWADLSKQSGLHLHVDYAPGDPQEVFAILSKEPVPYPGQLYELWDIVDTLEAPEDEPGDKLRLLDSYEGPYKLEIPEELFGAD